jgi:hypothetical protein
MASHVIGSLRTQVCEWSVDIVREAPCRCKATFLPTVRLCPEDCTEKLCALPLGCHVEGVSGLSEFVKFRVHALHAGAANIDRGLKRGVVLVSNQYRRTHLRNLLGISSSKDLRKQAGETETVDAARLAIINALSLSRSAGITPKPAKCRPYRVCVQSMFLGVSLREGLRVSNLPMLDRL